ncbi:MAG: iron dicitrate transport regulator FecR [Phenylobacterium zucineum]|nr:MAG: iron dicitrate transport regulator FecR [Phenylobacterium zucineum]
MSAHLVQNAETTKERAVAWFLRLQGESLSVEDGLAFDAWLEETPENAETYAHLLSVMDAYGQAGSAVLDGLKQAQRISVKRSVEKSRAFALGFGVLAAALVLAFVTLPQGTLISQTSDFATVKGEHQSVKLADGSTIDMNAESRLSVTLAPHERHVVMGQGEAVFDVAHDPTRPFEIETGRHLVHVLGTQFDVRNRPEGFSVIVSRGVVQVHGDGATYVLRKGDHLDLAPGGAARVTAGDPTDALGWRTGHLVYRDQPLSRVVADLNRQFPEQISIADETLAREKVSGVLVLDNQNQVLTRLALMLPLKTVKSDQGVVLQPK